MHASSESSININKILDRIPSPGCQCQLCHPLLSADPDPRQPRSQLCSIKKKVINVNSLDG